MSQRGAAHKVVDGLHHFVAAERLGFHRVDGGLQRAGRHQLLVVSVTAKVQDLHGDLAARLVHRVGHWPVFGGFFGGGQARATGHGAATVVGCDAAGHDKADATARALGIKGGHAGEAVLDLFESDVHRAHDDAVGQCGETEIQRLEQMGVGDHETSCRKIRTAPLG